MAKIDPEDSARYRELIFKLRETVSDLYDIGATEAVDIVPHVEDVLDGEDWRTPFGGAVHA